MPKKILLVQPFSNGDCLYATAIARQIKEDYPGCRLTWAIAPFCRAIIANNPYVDEVMDLDSVPKNDVKAFRRFKQKVLAQKAAGVFDEVFVTSNMDTNQAYYDGSIRSCIFRAYPHPVTVPVTPVLRLTAGEKEQARGFAARHRLQEYERVVLFEYAPQSGQLVITAEKAIALAEGIIKNGNTAIILSSANQVIHPSPAIIDGSALSIRETAAITPYCSLLIGCSSGISWITTSDAAKLLPMVQLVDAATRWANPVSRDFERFKLPVDRVIDLVSFNEQLVTACVAEAMDNFEAARKKYNQPIPLHFKSTRYIVYNLLCYLEFRAIRTHIRVNREVYGNNPAFYAEVLMGFLVFPFWLLRNTIVKRSFFSSPNQPGKAL